MSVVPDGVADESPIACGDDGREIHTIPPRSIPAIAMVMSKSFIRANRKYPYRGMYKRAGKKRLPAR
jgi:hypothetical protein